MGTLNILLVSLFAGKTTTLYECAEKAQEQQPFTIKPKLTGEKK
tara:strand:+ start:258 stop:389 length:132 start_codon:yes stop_codon:yes gene_type:complete